MKKATKLKIVEEASEVKFPIVMFDGAEFEIHPISDRTDDFAYEDSARFIAQGVPLASKIMNQILKVGADNQQVTDRIQKAQASGEDHASVIIDLVGIVSKLDIGGLLDDVSDTLPKLAAIACHYTDPDVTKRDIKKWSKSPLNKELWRAVIAQFTADNVMAQVGNLTGLLSEFGKAA